MLGWVTFNDGVAILVENAFDGLHPRRGVARARHRHCALAIHVIKDAAATHEQTPRHGDDDDPS